MAGEKLRYIVVTSTNLSSLEQQVDKFIKQGYRPYGDFVAAQEAGVSELTFFQPMLLASATPAAPAAAAKPAAPPAAAKPKPQT